MPGKVNPPRAPNKVPDGTSQEEMMAPIFKTDHPSLKLDDEKASYTSKISSTKPGDATFGLTGTEATFFDFLANASKTDAQLGAEMQTGFDAQRSEDMEFTQWKQWVAEPITRKDQTQKVDNKVEVLTTENVWVTVASSKAVPHQSFASPGGELALGSDPALGTATSSDERPAGITLPDKSVAALHAKITTSGSPDAAVDAETGQTVTFQGKAAGSFTGTVPVSFSVGPFAISMRPEKQRLATAQLTRTLVHWRRPLRKDDPKVSYGKDRPLVVPDVDNKDHYGSSDDPAPSDADLAKLFE